MPIVTLKFSLPEEETEFRQCIDSAKLYSAVAECMRVLRSKRKYEDLHETEQAVWEAAEHLLWDALSEHGIEDYF